MKVSEFEELVGLANKGWLVLEDTPGKGPRAYARIGSTKVRLTIKDLEAIARKETTPTIERVHRMLDARVKNLQAKARATHDQAKRRGETKVRLQR